MPVAQRLDLCTSTETGVGGPRYHGAAPAVCYAEASRALRSIQVSQLTVDWQLAIT
jgi:hypothetical protein